MTTPDLSKLIELAYSAAVEDDLWREWALAVVEEFDAPGALFWVIDSNRVDMCQNHTCFRGVDNAAVAREYLSGPVQADPQMARVCSVRATEIYLDTDHVRLDDPRTKEYLDWQEAVVGTRHYITSSVVLADGLQAGISLHRSRLQGPATDEVTAQVRTLFPEFARALRLGFSHSEAVHESWWDGLSGVAKEARILLTHDGRILRTNPAADLILARSDGLRIAADRIHCLDTHSDSAVFRAIDLACRPEQSRGSSIAVRRIGGRSPYLLSVYPLMRRRRFLAPYGATALICITDPSVRIEALTDQQAIMLRLTSREAELARLLIKGHSLFSASEMLGISYNTVRIHLRALFYKTNTCRQSELMLFLQRLS